MKRNFTAVQDENAQGLIEFALILTILMILFLGAVDYSRFLYYDQALQSAARVGAETASNHCPYASSSCGQTLVATSDTYVMWSTYCEAAPYIKATPSYTSCVAGSYSSWTPTCAHLPCTNCLNDICVSPPCLNDICVSPSDRASGKQVTVAMGWSFKPISFYMSQFFSDTSCFTGDVTTVNHHTICASAVGKVF